MNKFIEGFKIGTVIFLFAAFAVLFCSVVATHTPVTLPVALGVVGFMIAPVPVAFFFPNAFGPRM